APAARRLLPGRTRGAPCQHRSARAGVPEPRSRRRPGVAGGQLMVAAVRQLGSTTTRVVADLGAMALFLVEVMRDSVTPPWRPRNVVDELYKLGFLSLLIICVSGLAVGMVLGLQGYNTLVRFGATQSLGAVVGLSLVRELGPVLTALLVTGR